MTIRDLLLQGSQLIATGTESSTTWLDAVVLFGISSGMRTENVLASLRDPIPDAAHDFFLAMCQKRAQGYPVAYLSGKKEFFGRDFFVSEAVLIPRPETEILVEWVLEYVAARRQTQLENKSDEAARILDCCTGSGCIGITIAIETGLTVEVCDVSTDALAIAERNARQLGAQSLTCFWQGDLFDALPASCPPFDIICANPPYVPRAESMRTQERGWAEPLIALDGGHDGLDLIRRLATQVPRFLAAGGSLFMEYGDGQTDAIKSILSAAGFGEIEIRTDLGGIDRIVRARMTRYDGARAPDS